MAGRTHTFSEFWYRVADQHVALRPQVRARRQTYRGTKWVLIHDPFNNQFFRLRLPAWDFVSRLRPDRTVQDAWQECLDLFPDAAPGQEEAIQLIAQLYFANLLHFDMPADSARFFERYRKRRQREHQSQWMNVMFARFPLLDPDAFLVRVLPFLRWIFGPAGAVLWILIVAAAVKTGIDRFPDLVSQTRNVLAPGNLFLLYIGMAIVKTLHEFGHALACRRFGGEVHTMGVMLLLFTPVPYMDATSSWAFRERGRRVLVGAAGMLTELFVAALAMFVWAATGPGAVHAVAYNMIFVASVSSVLFNGNPLLRYDAYYILSDLADIPNLYQRSLQQLRHLAERHLFGCQRSQGAAHTRGEAVWLAGYGVLSFVYRLVVFTGMILFVADRFLIVGMIMAAVCAVSWLAVPSVRFVHYLLSSPALERTRPRAAAVSAGLAALVLIATGLVPAPSRFRTPGILLSETRSDVVNESAGRLVEILTASGANVTNGQPLVRLADDDLADEEAAARARLEQSLAMQRRALPESAADLEPVNRHIEAVRRQMARLRERREGLVVRSSQAGLWIASDLASRSGEWMPRGTRLGAAIDPDRVQFSAVVPQSEASRLFEGRLRGAEVRLKGAADRGMKAGPFTVIPAQQDRLRSAALGWTSGGEVQVSDTQGMKASEPFFEVKAALAPNPGVARLQGRTGRIEFTLAPEPLLRQWMRSLRQLLQRRTGP